MVAMTGPRPVRTRKGEIYSFPVAANAKIFQGALVVMAAGVANKGSTALNLVAVGIARETVDNTGGAAAALSIEVQPDKAYLKNSASTDAITLSDVGNDCYIVDDQTVAKTNGGGTRSVAGKVKYVDPATNDVLVAVG